MGADEGDQRLQRDRQSHVTKHREPQDDADAMGEKESDGRPRRRAEMAGQAKKPGLGRGRADIGHRLPSG